LRSAPTRGAIAPGHVDRDVRAARGEIWLSRGALAVRRLPLPAPGFTPAVVPHARTHGAPALARPRDHVAAHAPPRRPRRVS
jgi:hypothetical protein